MNRVHIKQLVGFAKAVAILLGMIGTLYVFHKKVILSDMEGIFITRTQASEYYYSKLEGKVVEARVVDMHDDLKEMKADIKKLLLKND